jgi:hypothetical protein
MDGSAPALPLPPPAATIERYGRIAIRLLCKAALDPMRRTAFAR